MNTDRFKFRVWDKTVNRYFQDEEFCINCFGSLVIQSEFDGDSLRDMDDFIIEQCTGMKDKNGMLIYEGDFIRFPHSKLKGSVRWCECFGAWVVKCKGRREMFFDPGWEIIGNIH